MIIQTQHPIIAAAMNQVSNADLAIACHNAGIMPSISFLNFVNKETGVLDLEGFKKEIDKFNQATNSDQLIISIGTKTLTIMPMIDKLKKVLNEVNYSHIELLVTSPLELTDGKLTSNDYKLFEIVKDSLNKITDKKLLYKSIDKFSALGLQEKYGNTFFDAYVLKSTAGAGSVSKRKEARLIDDIKEFKQLHPTACIIASGGISNYQHIQEYLDAGAEAVAIGTLFAASIESPLSTEAKQQYVTNSFREIKKVNGGIQNGLVFSKIENDDSNNTLSLKQGIQTGNTGHIFAGSGIHDVRSIISVKEIVNNLTTVSGFNLDSFCPEAYNQIEIDAQGDFKLCCLANFSADFGMARDKNNRIMNIMTHTIDEAMNSETHKSHRLELSKNIKPERCRNCYDSEDSTRGVPGFFGTGNNRGVSKRQRVLWQTSPKVPQYTRFNEAHLVTGADGSIDTSVTKVVNLDLRFGNLCNQKCIMCSPQHSNQWYEDWAALSAGPEEYNRGSGRYKKGKYKEYPLYMDEAGRTKMQGVPNWWESDKWWNTFNEIAPSLRHIYFTGGEPLVVPAMQKTLDILIDKEYANNIELRYDTNLSVINDKVISKWKHFKNVNLCVSIDDVEERYELIRFPGNFERVKSNLIKVQESGIPIHYISTCVGTASPYSVIRVCALGKELGIPCNFRFLEGPNWLDMRHLPKAAKLEIIENLKKHFGYQLYDKWATAEIKLLEKYIDEVNYDHLNEFVRAMDILDNRRGTNWRKTLHDVYDLFKKHCPEILGESN